MASRTVQNLSVAFWLLLGVVYPALTMTEPVVTKAGGTFVLYCDLEGEGVQWYGPNGKEIKNDGEKYIIQPINNTLSVSKTGGSDVGEYRCQTLSGNNYTFTVVSPPAAVKPLDKSVNLVQEETLELECIVWGNPSPKIIWIKNVKGENMEVTSTGQTLVGNNGTTGNAKLIITAVTYDDYGTYTCNASNEYGSIQMTTKVRVKDKLAPLWPFIGICVEVIILVIIIIIYEKRKSSQNYDEDAKEEGSNLTNSNDHQDKEKVRLRSK